MRVDWAMLANSAEVRDGLCFVLGGGFDTVSAAALPAPFAGTVLIRLAMTPSEAAGPHSLDLVILDEDGKELSRARASMKAERADIPLGWEQGALLSIRVEGTLDRYGLYRLDILVDGRHGTSLNFRVLELAPA